METLNQYNIVEEDKVSKFRVCRKKLSKFELFIFTSYGDIDY